MRHFTTDTFWRAYDRLPQHVQSIADKNFVLLQADPRHPSLHLKRVRSLWSVRVGRDHRALARELESGAFSWFWIGTHAEYDDLIR